MAISTPRGIALYVGALLGPGLLVLPGLAAAAAGPASILAWIGLLVLSGLVAVVFARFGVSHPSGAGVAGYARLGLGEWAGRAVGWCFLGGIIAGAPIVCYLGAGYLASLSGAGRGLTGVAGGAMLAVVLAVSLRGIRTSTGVQLVLIGVLVLVIVVAVVGAAPSSRAANWTPFAPHGWSAIGSAATVLMLSFVGWEAIAPLTDRFAEPRRQLPRVIGAAFAVTVVIYLALAAVTVAALGPAADTTVPMAELLTRAIGGSGDAVAAAAAVLLTIATVNAYLTGGATLARTLTARPGPDFPRWFLAAIVVSGVAGSALLGHRCGLGRRRPERPVGLLPGGLPGLHGLGVPGPARCGPGRRRGRRRRDRRRPRVRGLGGAAARARRGRERGPPPGPGDGGVRRGVRQSRVT